MLRLTELAHRLIREVVKPGDWVVDATVGNAHDTSMLADAVGATGYVIGFDVQAAALARARAKLGAQLNVSLHQCGHEHMAERLPVDAQHRLSAVMFNLGYLPGAERTITTSAETTITALEQAVGHLAVGGRITLMLYTGHPGGADEADALRTFANELPPTFSSTRFARMNSDAAVPELILIERIR